MFSEPPTKNTDTKIPILILAFHFSGSVLFTQVLPGRVNNIAFLLLSYVFAQNCRILNVGQILVLYEMEEHTSVTHFNRSFYRTVSTNLEIPLIFSDLVHLQIYALSYFDFPDARRIFGILMKQPYFGSYFFINSLTLKGYLSYFITFQCLDPCRNLCIINFYLFLLVRRRQVAFMSVSVGT